MVKRSICLRDKPPKNTTLLEQFQNAKKKKCRNRGKIDPPNFPSPVHALQ